MTVFGPFSTLLIIISAAVLPYALVQIFPVMTPAHHDALVIIKQVGGIRTETDHIPVVSFKHTGADHVGPGHYSTCILSLHQAGPDGDHIDPVLSPVHIKAIVRRRSVFFLLPLSALILNGIFFRSLTFLLSGFLL